MGKNVRIMKTLDFHTVDSLLRTPERIAFSQGADTVTCSDIVATAHRLADRLRNKNLTAGTPVVLYMGHDLMIAAGMLGILLAGGCVVPLDPELPQDRQRTILNDISPEFIVANSDEHLFKESAHTIVLERVEAKNLPHTFSGVAEHTPENLAFIIYTSGTTGTAKGVEITHHAYLSRLQAVVERNPTAAMAIDLVWTPASFIGFFDEVFFPMLVGCRAVIAPHSLHNDPHGFVRLIDEEGVTQCRCAPTVLSTFLRADIADISDKLSSLKMVFASGETLPTATQNLFFSTLPQTLLFGFYGATEAPGVGKHLYDAANPAMETTQIDVQDFVPLRIVTSQGNDARQGGTGEIWLGGSIIARGYWKNPEETDRKFHEEGGQRWYKTGDFGRFMADGRVEVLGRADKTEININAIRVNLNDVQRAVLDHPQIREAHVDTLQLDAEENPILVCHCISDGLTHLDSKLLRRHLRSRLPVAAIPRRFFFHDAFPITVNGKLAPLVLMQRAQSEEGDTKLSVLLPAHLAPQGSVEKVLSEIWCRILKLAQISRQDHFFDLGGDSLAFVEMIIEVEKTFQTTVETKFRDIDVTLETLRQELPGLDHIAHPEAFVDVPTQPPLAWHEVRRRMLLATTSWQGNAIGRDLPILEFNKNGSQQPLFWCFNGAAEPAAMARTLGPDQPLYALRSMQSVVENEEKPKYHDEIAHDYAKEILAIRPSGTIYLGGNCQSGHIIEKVSANLVSKGRTIGGMFFLEYEPEKATDIPVSLFFGRDSRKYNPFFREDRPYDNWRTLFPSVTWDIVPGDHGQYFSPSLVDHFITQLCVRLNEARVRNP
jgi:acyl-CoA synthetase (AMP-forming)/AMP-acid ligase II/acyl carrier protein